MEQGRRGRRRCREACHREEGDREDSAAQKGDRDKHGDLRHMPHTCKHRYFQVETDSERGDSVTVRYSCCRGRRLPRHRLRYMGVIETQRRSGGVNFLKRKVGERVGGGCWGQYSSLGPGGV